MVELTEVDVAQMTNHQTQLEEAVGVMSQEIGIIKQLLERLLIPRASTTTRCETAIKEWCAEQQVTKTTMRGKVTSERRANFQQVPHS